MKEILKGIRKADEDFHLIDDGDCIVVGVSGGKDSMALLFALCIYQQFRVKNFNIIAVHINLGFKENDMSPIQEFTSKYKIPLHIINTSIYKILKLYKKKDSTIDCSRCSNLKRGAIVNIAKELKANKIAFAHYGDDAIETLWMNAIYSSKLNTFEPKIFYQNNQITLIRPMVYLQEKNIMKAVKRYSIPYIESGCPKDKMSSRAKIKELLLSIEKINPHAKSNMINALKYNENIWNTK